MIYSKKVVNSERFRTLIIAVTGYIGRKTSPLDTTRNSGCTSGDPKSRHVNQINFSGNK
jgi:hypothetical protein